MDRENEPAPKKFKNESGSSVAAGQDNQEDVHKVAPSPVVHVRGLPEHITDADLLEAVGEFGTVSYVTQIPKKNMALIEFEDIDSAVKLVNYAKSFKVFVAKKQALFNYSTSTRIKRPDSHPELPPNVVILLTITNVRHPITVEVISSICAPFGTVLRIVIFRKTGCQAMVEFDSIDSATKAKVGLNGQEVYAGCCSIKSEFARPSKLNVHRNNNDTWDFTLSSLNDKDTSYYGQQSRCQPLLSNPRSGPVPYGMGGGNGNPYRGNNPMSGQMMPPMGPYGNRGGGGYRDAGYDSQHSNFNSPLTPMALLNAYESVAATSMSGANPNCVIMVYGMDSQQFNCQRLFNLLCIYGNVLKIKFLKSKEDSAMVQMSDKEGCDRIMQYLNNKSCLGKQLSIRPSKQPYLQQVVSPHQLPDGSSAYQDFTGSRNLRFVGPDSVAKNRPTGPTATLYFYNAPPNANESVLREVFVNAGISEPDVVKFLQPKSEKSSRGLLVFSCVESSMEALIYANHSLVDSPAGGKPPFVLRLSFTNMTGD